MQKIQNRIVSAVLKYRQNIQLVSLSSSNLFHLSLFFVIVFGFIHAQSTSENIWNQYLPAWFPLFAIAVLIGYGLAGIAFMLSRVFITPSLETWARLELFEVTSSAFLVLIIFIALGAIDSIFVAATGNTPMDASLEFMDEISNKLMDIYLDNVKFGYALGLLSGPPLQYLQSTQQDAAGTPDQGATQTSSSVLGSILRFSIVGIESFHLSYYPFYGADVFNSHYSLMQTVSLTALMISIFSSTLLDFVASIAIPVAIPLGLFLSIFSFTRKMGRTLIAFGVGLYLFVPMSILIGQTMYDSAYKADTAIPNIGKPHDVDKFISGILAAKLSEILLNISVMTLAMLGTVSFAIPCVLGGAAASVLCGIAAPACAVAFATTCGTITAPLFHLPTGLDQTATLSTIITAITTSMIGNTLGVDISGYIPMVSLPAIHSIVGLSTMFPWIMSIIGVLAPNPILIATGIISSLLNIVSEMALFMANVTLNKALAIKLTEITMDYTPYVLQYAVPVMLIPFIMIVIVITGIRSLSPAIGGEVQILGVSELI